MVPAAGFQTAEDVAYQYLRSLPPDQCPATAGRDIRQLRTAVTRRVLDANQEQIDHFERASTAYQRKRRTGRGKRG